VKKQAWLNGQQGKASAKTSAKYLFFALRIDMTTRTLSVLSPVQRYIKQKSNRGGATRSEPALQSSFSFLAQPALDARAAKYMLDATQQKRIDQGRRG